MENHSCEERCVCVCVCVCIIQTNGVYSPESMAMFSLFSGNPTDVYIMEKRIKAQTHITIGLVA